ncbi:CRISPR-associated endoribonuclease Cas6 [Arsenicibacter rosenii]|uniref:CRISPR-associated endoribonuclease Cas6 n=1 Tax=Arsenicibacter rosenii TaxID=1750698 RepID=UPI0009F4BE6D|nr:CRISPR-associated endoribonuclease Cas6 [Arsenicibacter rosenii]
MRFKLTLTPAHPRTIVPFNYAYRLTGWLYGLLHDAEPAYAQFLHERGYVVSATKRFKLFTFSDLQIQQFTVRKDLGGIEVRSPTVVWYVCFQVERAAEHFLMGLFQNQDITIASPRHRADLLIERVESLPDLSGQWPAEEPLRLRTLSPMVVAEKDDTGMDQYLHPSEPLFGRLLIQNLIDKHRSIQLDARAYDPGEFSFALLPEREPRSRLMTIKEGSRAQTQVRGWYDFNFTLSGPREVLDVGLNAGFGRYNAEGCGCVEVVRQKATSVEAAGFSTG